MVAPKKIEDFLYGPFKGLLKDVTDPSEWDDLDEEIRDFWEIAPYRNQNLVEYFQRIYFYFANFLNVTDEEGLYRGMSDLVIFFSKTPEENLDRVLDGLL